MGIDKIRLGKRSRILEAQEEAVHDEVAHPPVPGPANPTSLVGCACGRWHVPDRHARIEEAGVVHRYGGPCYRVDGAPMIPSQPVPTSEAMAAIDLTVAGVREELAHLQERIDFLESQLRGVHLGSAWEAAHEPISTPAGQDPFAAGHPVIR